MSALAEFLHMGGYAFYVWGSYGVAALVFAFNLAAPVLRRRRIERALRNAREREAAPSAPRGTTGS